MSEMNQNYDYTQERPDETPQKRTRRKKRRPLGVTILIRVMQVLGTLVLIGIVTGAFMACYAAVYVKSSVIPNAHLDLSAYTLSENSTIYYYDKNTGLPVELQTLVGNENREWVDYNDIPEDLVNAFVAIEDKRFWSHNGVDWKRTAAGLLYMFTGHSIQGGSTITQQLIKNLTEYDDVTVTRKIQEIFTALDLEDNYKKETLLTWYFNKIYLGNSCYGVQAAAQYYFGKDVWDLSLAECASLAGITNNPSLYAPYGVVDVMHYKCKECGNESLTKDTQCENCGALNSFDDGVRWTNRDFNKARQELILQQMAKPDISPDGAYISEAARDAAIAEKLVFARDLQTQPDNDTDDDDTNTQTSSVNSWYVDAVINEVTNALMESTGLNREMCTQLVYSGGLQIFVPYDPDVQAAVDEVYTNRANLDFTSNMGEPLQSAITVVDNSTGYVVAMAGAVGEKTINRAWNNALATRQPGSSIKPLSVYSPGLEMGLITPASVSDDNPRLLNGKPWPLNAPLGYNGLMTIQDAVTVSKNTVAVNVLEKVTPQESYKYMTEKYGITTLEPYMVTKSGEVKSDIDISPLAMGGLTHGVSTFEMAAAYATFPRNGSFTKATTFLEVKDSNGKTLVDNKPQTKDVIKSSTAYYINAMLTNVVNAGTGTSARISGQTVAGKTGTTNDEKDLWFCGYTSYYTAAVWVGYAKQPQVIQSHTVAMKMWQLVMSRIHEGLGNSSFSMPDNLNRYDICVDCGNLAGEDCAKDSRGGRVRSFQLLPADAPKEYCTCHVPVTVCTESPVLDSNGNPTGLYHLAREFCPEESVQEIVMVDYTRKLADPSVRVKDANSLLSVYDSLEDPYCPIHLESGEPDETDNPDDPLNSDEPDVTDEPGIESDSPSTDEPVASEEPSAPPEEPTASPSEDLPPEDSYVPVVDPEPEN